MIELRQVRVGYLDNPVVRMTRWIPRVSAKGTSCSVVDAHFKESIYAVYGALEASNLAVVRRGRPFPGDPP